MRLTLHVWRQKDPRDPGRFKTYELEDVSTHMSFLEMLDVLNQDLINRGEDPIAFEHDCREGICGSCGMVIDGVPHGSQPGTTCCQLHMRHFSDGDEVVVEPWRAKAFPVVKDLVVDRSAFDRIVQAGGFISARVGSAPDGNAMPIGKDAAERAMDFAECIGCGACVASCPNGAAMLFVGAKIAHLGTLPQGQPERLKRARAMVEQMEREAFGACTNYRACEAACPKEISIQGIAMMNRDYRKAMLSGTGPVGGKRAR
ncbi:MAG: succinate dehydrogenase/fumarate reductase iron-sulfur subunit [Thermoanaerobaculaceae bacterium]|jgi:succinate dehydrogenase / fumarate reductase iron-sulfur subunit|nr:succinate dehydrogenase/fumarate reductase iron-sulfur subunit [Thermoanaerobaculaceae bacterium]